MSNPLDKIDKYEIVEEIGRGGMAVVYKGIHPFLESYVAIKVLPEYFVQDKEFVDRFTREAKTMMSLHHHNIVRIYDAGIYENKYFIVMDYIEGKTLKDLIKKEGHIEIERAVRIIGEVCEALSYAHKNSVIHRDVKPSNIIIEDKTGKSYITDFGIAKAVSGTKLTETGVSLGTPEYMSPEQFSEKGSIDQRTDIYSLGIVFYEMLTGDIPFKGDTPLGVAYKHVNTPPPHPRILNPLISPYLEKIILKMLAKDLDERYSSMDEVIKDLHYFNNKEYNNISALSYTEEKKCKLTINSDPDDAKVYIDGEYIGKTPIKEFEIGYGKHKVLVVKSQYEDALSEIIINRLRKTYFLNVSFKKEALSEAETKEIESPQPPLPSEDKTGKVERETTPISSSEQLTQKVEKEALVTPSEQETKKVEIGEKAIRFPKVSEEKKKKLSFLKPSVIIPLLVLVVLAPLVIFMIRGRGEKLVNPVEKLSIISNPPSSEVYIDDNMIGTTPIENYIIKTGTHKILLKKEGYEDLSAEFEIKQGENNKSLPYTLNKITVAGNETKKDVPVSISSNPTSAKVYIDDKYVGDTPIDNSKLPIGTHALKLTKDGYNDYTQTFTLASSDTSKAIPVTLTKTTTQPNEQPANTPKTGTLSVTSSPTGAKVYINDNYKGITPLNLNLNSGGYNLKLSKDGYMDCKTSFSISQGETNYKNVPLSKVQGKATIHIDTNPHGALIYIDGKIIGNSPVYFYKIDSGIHEVKAQKDGYMDYIGNFEIRPNEVKTLDIPLSSLP